MTHIDENGVMHLTRRTPDEAMTHLAAENARLRQQLGERHHLLQAKEAQVDLLADKVERANALVEAARSNAEELRRQRDEARDEAETARADLRTWDDWLKHVRAEVKVMRPVVEAAEALVAWWAASGSDPLILHDEPCALIAAVDSFRAQAASPPCICNPVHRDGDPICRYRPAQPGDTPGELVPGEDDVTAEPTAQGGDQKAPGRCPTCDSHSPQLHPAMQAGGEVQPCRDAWHGEPDPRWGLPASLQNAPSGGLSASVGDERGEAVAQEAPGARQGVQRQSHASTFGLIRVRPQAWYQTRGGDDPGEWVSYSNSAGVPIDKTQVWAVVPWPPASDGTNQSLIQDRPEVPGLAEAIEVAARADHSTNRLCLGPFEVCQFVEDHRLSAATMAPILTKAARVQELREAADEIRSRAGAIALRAETVAGVPAEEADEYPLRLAAQYAAQIVSERADRLVAS